MTFAEEMAALKSLPQSKKRQASNKLLGRFDRMSNAEKDLEKDAVREFCLYRIDENEKIIDANNRAINSLRS